MVSAARSPVACVIPSPIHHAAQFKLLAKGRTLPAKYKDHQLKGIYKDCRECHIEPDWLLSYRIEAHVLQLVRTGSHSDLPERETAALFGTAV